MKLDIKIDALMYIALIVATIIAFQLSYSNYFHYEHDIKKGISSEKTEAQIADIVNSTNLDSTNSLLQLKTARMLFENNKSDLAIPFYHRYEKLDTMTADLFVEIGTVMWLVKPSAKSVIYFVRALKLDSINAGALFGLGRAMLEIGSKDAAKEKFRKVVYYHKNTHIAEIAVKWIESIEKMKTNSQEN